jgi:hypothetical protein
VTLVSELECLIDGADPRWLAFGLNIPAADEPHEPVEDYFAVRRLLRKPVALH